MCVCTNTCLHLLIRDRLSFLTLISYLQITKHQRTSWPHHFIVIHLSPLKSAHNQRFLDLAKSFSIFHWTFRTGDVDVWYPSKRIQRKDAVRGSWGLLQDLSLFFLTTHYCVYALALGLPQRRAALRGSGLDTSKDGAKAPSTKMEKQPSKTLSRLLSVGEMLLEIVWLGPALQRRGWKGTSWSLFLIFEPHFKQ